jgi:pimeloyl-ACP methyl ester carboxylesterase
MQANNLLVALLLFAAWLLAGCGPKETPDPIVVPDGAKAGELTGLKDCEFQNGSKKPAYSAECGTLIVPENWDKADSHLIALPVVRIPATGQDPAEPVFYLQGGPGQSNLSWAPPDWLLKDHDVVMVGYRGAEGTVTLTCPELIRALNPHKGNDFYSEQARADGTVAVKQCATRLHEAGVDLSGYTIPGVVEDIEAARIALGYDGINLFSVSYGTRVAQIYAYMHPDSLHRLALIGVNTPGHFIWDRTTFDGIISHISELCAQDTSCSSRTTDFGQTMYVVNHNMPKRWLFFKIDPDTVRHGTHLMFFSNPKMALILDAYLAAGEGDPSGLAMINLLVKLASFDPIFGDQFSKVASADMEKYHGFESVSLGNSIMGAPLSESVWPMAKEWPVESIVKNLRDFQESDVEMLLVNGTVDFSTPPIALEEAKPYFHKAQMVLLPEFSHVDDVQDLQPQAFERLITSYYDTGVADSSLYVYQPLSFQPKMSLTVAAKLLVAAMIVLPVLIILGVVLAVRRIRRRRMITS